MADARHLQFLFSILHFPDGSGRWLRYRQRFLRLDLAGAALAGKKLCGYAFNRADLAGADLSGANLADCNLAHTDLRRARLAGCNLTGADLTGANLTEADLTGAILRYASLRGVRVDDAVLEGADLTGAVFDPGALAPPAALGSSHYQPPVWPAFSPEWLIKDRAAAEESADRLRSDPTDRLRPDQIPQRVSEPDLSTTEGCCQVLAVAPGAPLPLIISVFRTQAMLYHPDRTGHLLPADQALAAREFCRLRAAYEALTRPQSHSLAGIHWPEGISPGGALTMADYERLAASNPAHPGILYNFACRCFMAGDPRRAQELFIRVLELDGNDEDARYNLMMCRLLNEIVHANL